MSFPAILCVIYTGVVGRGAEGLDRQLAALLGRAVTLEHKALSLDQRKILARHQPEAREIVSGLGTDAVVAAELTRGKSGRVLHVVLYAGSGARKDVLELPLDGDLLGSDDVAAVESNLVPDVKRLAKAPRPPPPAPEPPPLVATTPPPETPPAAPTDQPPITAEEPPDHLGLDGAVGLGVAFRSFAPGPKSIIGYSASAVPTVRFDGTIRPRPSIALYFSAERSLGMTTQLTAERAPTDMQRWEIAGEVDLLRAAVRVGALAGVGHRAFTIESKDPARTPDGDYTYLILGVQASAGPRTFCVTGLAAVQPVTGGAEPTDMDFGGSRRWAVDLELSLDWQPAKTLFLRPRIAWQRFAWSFPDAGTRGEGGAVDQYLMGEISLGARY